MKKVVILGTLFLIGLAAMVHAVVIPGATATANFSEGTGAAMSAVDGFGFTPIDPNGWTGTHGTGRDSGGRGLSWVSKTVPAYPGTWIKFDLGTTITKLKRIKVWNLNWKDSTDYTGSGISDMEIRVTDTSNVETSLGDWTLAKAPGVSTYDFGQVLDIPDQTNPRYVTFFVKDRFGGDRVGVSEVKFDGEGAFLDAGTNQTVTMTGTSLYLNLNGASSPNPATWTVDSKPASSTVIFDNSHSPATNVTLDWPGVYVLRLTDDVNANSKTVAITVNKTVTVGADQFVNLSAGPVTVNLSGTCTTAVTWTVDSAPDTVAFVPNADSLTPSVTLDTAGTYVLRMTDDLFGLYDTVKVSVVQANQPNALIGRWPFDGNANDATANGNNGIVRGAPQYVDGKVGKGIKFDGLSDGIEIPNEWFFEEPDPSITVTCWAKVPYGARLNGVVVGKRDYHNYPNPTDGTQKGQGWGLVTENARNEGNVIFWTETPAGVRIEVGPSMYNALNDGKWHHYAAVTALIPGESSKYNVTLYVDGVSQGTGTSSTTRPITPTNMLNDAPVSFGYATDFPGLKNWAGYLDDVRIYNYALDATAVQAIFNGDGGVCAEIAGDINGDCEVTFDDFVPLAQDWLECGKYFTGDCLP